MPSHLREPIVPTRSASLLTIPIAVALAAFASPARGAPPDERARGVEWHDEWRRSNAADVTLVGALGATMLGIGLAAPGSKTPGWVGDNGFDDGIREGLRASSRGGRRTAAAISDVLYLSLTVYPLVVDTLVLAGLVHRRRDVVIELLLTYAESALSSGVATVASQGLGGRARPLVAECAGDREYDPMCGSRQQSRSFFAGHVAMAFNSASLVCVTQAYLPLYGARAGGAAACASTLLAASATGVLRVVADKHWASDVLVGSAVGTATGLLFPLLLHYTTGARSAVAVLPDAGQDYVGLHLTLGM